MNSLFHLLFQFLLFGFRSRLLFLSRRVVRCARVRTRESNLRLHVLLCARTVRQSVELCTALARDLARPGKWMCERRLLHPGVSEGNLVSFELLCAALLHFLQPKHALSLRLDQPHVLCSACGPIKCFILNI